MTTCPETWSDDFSVCEGSDGPPTHHQNEGLYSPLILSLCSSASPAFPVLLSDVRFNTSCTSTFLPSLSTSQKYDPISHTSRSNPSHAEIIMIKQLNPIETFSCVLIQEDFVLKPYTNFNILSSRIQTAFTEICGRKRPKERSSQS